MKNILVVEDDKLTIDFYKIILKRTGYNPIFAEDGEKILSLLGEGGIDLIIMDINLKNTYLAGEKFDGIRLSELIKDDSRFSGIPIIIVTAYTPDILRKKYGNDLKADGFLNKPIVDFNLLINKVNGMVLN